MVLGATGVGKTCLTLRFVRGVFEDQLPTIGAAYLTKKVPKFVYEIWDTAGQERYRSISARALFSNSLRTTGEATETRKRKGNGN